MNRRKFLWSALFGSVAAAVTVKGQPFVADVEAAQKVMKVQSITINELLRERGVRLPQSGDIWAIDDDGTEYRFP